MTSFVTEPLADAVSSQVVSGPRVLHVLEATLGGTLRYIENLQAALACAPLTVGFAYGTRRADHRLEPALARARSLGWELFSVPMRREVHPPSDLASVRMLARIVRSFRPDVVHCHSSKAGALGRIACLALRPRPLVVYSPHAIAPGASYVRIERMLDRLTDRFLAVSDTERAQLADLRIGSPERTGVAYPTIDGEWFVPQDRGAARTALRLPHGKSLLLGIGRMTGQKRPLDFVELLHKVRMEVPDVSGIWVGDGELRGAFEAHAQALGIAEHVRVTGWIEDVRPYIAAANLAVTTSAFESFGYNMAEALAMERPAIGSAVCGTSDVLAGAHGNVFFETGDMKEAARLAVNILRSPLLAEQLGVEGRKSVLRRFSSEAMRADLLRCYAGVLAPSIARCAA